MKKMVKRGSLKYDISNARVINLINNKTNFSERAKKEIEETRIKVNKIEKEILDNHKKISLLL